MASQTKVPGMYAYTPVGAGWTNPQAVRISDDSRAQAIGANVNEHWRGFAFTPPGGVSPIKLEVIIEGANRFNAGGAARIQLFKNGQANTDAPAFTDFALAYNAVGGDNAPLTVDCTAAIAGWLLADFQGSAPLDFRVGIVTNTAGEMYAIDLLEARLTWADAVEGSATVHSYSALTGAPTVYSKSEGPVVSRSVLTGAPVILYKSEGVITASSALHGPPTVTVPSAGTVAAAATVSAAVRVLSVGASGPIASYSALTATTAPILAGWGTTASYASISGVPQRLLLSAGATVLSIADLYALRLGLSIHPGALACIAAVSGRPAYYKGSGGGTIAATAALSGAPVVAVITQEYRAAASAAWYGAYTTAAGYRAAPSATAYTIREDRRH